MYENNFIYCPDCGYRNDSYSKRCSVCQATFSSSSDPSAQKKKSCSCFSCCMFCMIFIFAIVAFLTRNNLVELNDKNSIANECFANLRVITGAVEMYNMDNREPITFYSLQAHDTLLQQGYLRSEIRCKDGGEYMSTGSLFAGSVIYCTKHGSLEEPILD